MIEGLRPYEEYRDSGVHWLGKVPAHWEVKRLKNAAEINKHSLPEDTDSFYEFDYLDIGAVGNGYLVSPPVRVIFKNAPSRARRIVRPRDTLVSTVRTYLKAVYTAGSNDRPLVASTGFAVLTSNSGSDSRYLGYLAQTDNFSSFVTAESVGIAYPAISESRFGNIAIPVPSLNEQAAIARFLDHANHRINRFIRAKKKLIALLNEQKQAIIHRAVTRGLDPNVPMKDSGVPWLGEVPEHWEVRKISQCFRSTGSGTTPPSGDSRYYKNGTIPWVNTGDLNDSILMDPARRVTKAALTELSALKKYDRGTIIVAMYGATIGKTAILGVDASVNQACCALLDPVHLEPEFALQALIALRSDLVNLASGGGQPNISQAIVRAFRLPCPPIAEQAEILSEIHNETGQITHAIERATREITLIQEYRTRLIADVVTGQLDVRAAAASLPELDPDEVSDSVYDDEPIEDEFVDGDEAA